MMGGMPSPDDLQQIEAEIDKFVRSLPPEQQAQFYKDVEELTGIMEKMSPDELTEFVGGVFTEAGLVEPAPTPQIEPVSTPTATPTQEVKPPVLVTPALTGPTEKAIAMLDSIIDSTEEFLRKAQIIPELSGKMNKWVTQKKVKNAPAQMSWESLQSKIEEFNALLYTLQDKDPKSGEYRHIGNLLKNEALYNNLAKMQVSLQAYVPLVIVPEFGLDKVTKQSRAAIREVLNQYLEAFFLLDVITEIKKAQQLYEGRAKELTDEEKKFADKAKSETEKPRQQSAAVRSSGSAGKRSAYDELYGNDYGYKPSSSYSPSYSPSSYDYDTPSNVYGDSSPRSPSPRSSAGSSGDKSGKSAANDDGGKGNKSDGSGKNDGKDGKDGKPSTDKKTDSDVKKDTALEVQLLNMKEKLDATVEPLKKFDPIFTKFKEHILDKKDFDAKLKSQDMASPDDFENLQKAIKSADDELQVVTTAITKFNKSLLKTNKATQDHYRKELEKTLKDSIKFYETLFTDLKAVKENPDLYKQNMHANKRYIFYGEDKAKASTRVKKVEVIDPTITATATSTEPTTMTDETATATTPPAKPTTMADMFKTIEAFLNEVKNKKTTK